MSKIPAFIFIILALTLSSAAQESVGTVSSSTGSIATIRVGVNALETKALTLREAIELALENSKELRVSRGAAKVAGYDVLAARGAFDPRFSGQSFIDNTKSPNVSIFSSNTSTTNKTVCGNASLFGLLKPTGTTVTASITSQKVSTNNPISLLSPQQNSNFNFSFAQPLLRGLRFDQARRVLTISKRSAEISNLQLIQKTTDTVTSVQKAYWDLVFALRNLQVQRDGLRDSREQLEHNRRLVAEGQLAPNDILPSETQVAIIEQAVFEATDIVGRAENALKNFIAVGKDDPLWSLAIVPTEQPKAEIPTVSLEDAIGSAMAKRPELMIAAEQVGINEAEKRFYKDQARPQIDLTASYTSAGIGGEKNPRFSSPFSSSCQTNPSTPSCVAQLALINGLVGNSFTDVWANNFPSLRVGITFNFTVGRKTTEAQLGKAIVQGQQIVAQQEQAQQLVQIDVRNTLQALRTAEAKLKASTIARENSEKQYESEKRKLDAGQSDIYRVLERQTAMLSARSGELRAQTELRKAVADYYRATGTTLEFNKIELK